jgi:hypothetical protein
MFYKFRPPLQMSSPLPDLPTTHRRTLPDPSLPLRRQNLNRWLGRYLGNLKLLAITLGVYFLLACATYVWLALQMGAFGNKAAVIAYDVATGASPAPYVGDVKPFSTVLWIWLAILHVFSWILVPIVIATAIDAMYRAHEQRRARAEKRLRKWVRKFGSSRYGYKGAELEDFTEQTLETIENLQSIR